MLLIRFYVLSITQVRRHFLTFFQAVVTEQKKEEEEQKKPEFFFVVCGGGGGGDSPSVPFSLSFILTFFFLRAAKMESTFEGLYFFFNERKRKKSVNFLGPSLF